MRDLARIAELVEHGSLDRRRSCEGKRAYLSRNDARHALKEMFAMSGRHGLTYRCPFNHAHWHITKLRHGETLDDIANAA